MRIRVIDIPEGGLKYQIDDKRTSIKIFDEDIPVVKAIKGYLVIKRFEAGRVQIKGIVGGMVELTCSRCLRPFDYVIEKEIFEECYPLEEFGFPERMHLKGEDLDVFYYSGGEIDLEEIYMEPVYLAIPMKPLCSESCKGICPICGRDLNEGECGCDKGVRTLKNYILEKLKEKLKGE